MNEMEKNPTEWLVKKAKETGFFSMDEIYELRQLLSTEEGRELIVNMLESADKPTIQEKIKKVLDNHK